MHELCHAIAGVLTCARIESIQLDPDEGGATRMRGGVPWITLPAGYLGSSFIGAALITCVSVAATQSPSVANSSSPNLEEIPRTALSI